MRCGQHVELDGKIRIDEISWVSLVLENAAHLAGRENDIVGRISVKEALDRLGIPQFELGMRRRQDPIFLVSAEAPQRGSSDEPRMTSDVYFRRGHLTDHSADRGRRGYRTLRTGTARGSTFSTARELQLASQASQTGA